MKIVGLSGSLADPSRTTALVTRILATAASSLHGTTELVTLASLGTALGTTLDPSNLPAPLRAAQQKLIHAEIIIVGTPIYKASYTGLLKHFFDLLAPDALRGKVAMLAATGGSEHHALALEHHLRPLLSFFGVHTVPTTLFARDGSFAKNDAGHYVLTDETLLQRINASVEQASNLASPGFRFAQHVA